jgi:hypothetical protein
MEVIGHQHLTEEQEFQFLPHFLGPLNKTTAKPLGEEKGRPPTGTGVDELQLPRAVSALVEWHPAREYALKNAMPEMVPSGGRRPDKTWVCASQRH